MRIMYSSVASSSGLPIGVGIATPRTIRLAPTVKAIGGTAVISAAGIPTLSISRANVAPQRVPVPQVDVRTIP